ncbi:hypothetical protein C9890_0290 [Perkinsus sp. BL_2016]|nr:hypothetical protein C9890_0290 [Perkinsus sp. BL_2016]
MTSSLVAEQLKTLKSLAGPISMQLDSSPSASRIPLSPWNPKSPQGPQKLRNSPRPSPAVCVPPMPEETEKITTLEATIASLQAKLRVTQDRADEACRDLETALSLIQSLDDRNKQLLALNERQRNIIRTCTSPIPPI